MEVQLYQMQMYSTIRVAVMYLMTIGSSVYASSSTGYVENYIAKSYFEKYDTLTEQDFNNFIANEVPLGLSKVLEDKYHLVPKQSSLHRNIIGEGSHRRLSSSIRFKLPHELKPELSGHSCEVVIIERLPSGVFADPFELLHLVQRGVFRDAAVFGDQNLELPSFRSNRSVVEIHMRIDSEMLSSYKDDLEIKLEVPLHARYPPLGHEFSRVKFGAPDLFMCCSVDTNVPSKRCLYMRGDHISDEQGCAVIWDIPCGSKEHAEIVSAVTFGFALVTALLIVLASISYSNKASSKLKSM